MYDSIGNQHEGALGIYQTSSKEVWISHQRMIQVLFSWKDSYLSFCYFQRCYIQFQDVSYSDEYTQCVFLKAVPDAGILSAYDVACKTLGITEPVSYMPHVSLLYSDVAVELRSEIAQETSELLFGKNSTHALVEEGFWTESLEVWKVFPADKSLGSWEKIAEFELM